MLTYGTGDLLHADADALVNTVNCVGVMGKGIALQFKRRYPANFQAYQKACQRGEVTVGTMFVTETGQLDGPRYVINFPTKIHWRTPSQMDYIDTGLTDLVRLLPALDIRSVAIPALGVGNGGLAWSHVERRLIRVLSKLPNIHATIYPPAPHTQSVSPERAQDWAGPITAVPQSGLSALLQPQAPITKADREDILGYDPTTGV